MLNKLILIPFFTNKYFYGKYKSLKCTPQILMELGNSSYSLFSSSDSIPFNLLFDDVPCDMQKNSHWNSDKNTCFSSKRVFTAILKVSNISWDTSRQDISSLLKIDKGRIHIPIEKETGKTCNSVFVQMYNIIEASQAIKNHDRKILKGRSLLMEVSSEGELHQAFFEDQIMLEADQVSSILSICASYKVH